MAEQEPTVPTTEAEWREALTDEEYAVLRERGTEPPGSGDLLDVTPAGDFVCAGCGAVLFDAETKFDSGTGWPSFSDAREGAVEFRSDDRHGMQRTEVVCATCDSHLGHVFDDGPAPTGERYCINSVALDVEEEL